MRKREKSEVKMLKNMTTTLTQNYTVKVLKETLFSDNKHCLKHLSQYIKYNFFVRPL